MMFRLDGPINSQAYKSFEIFAVTINISMTEYTVRLIIYVNTTVYGEKRVRLIRPLVYFHFFEAALNGALEAQFFFRASFVHLIRDNDSM